MDLVIMAAGMGSRFGGLKQIKPIDNDGNFIIDYSIYDAIQVGFDRVIIIIKKENFEDFDSTIGKRIKPFINVEYAFQEDDSFLPNNFKNIKRGKPWGTAHAILCAKDKIKDDFVLINADDFYGRESFKIIFDFLKNIKTNNNAMVAYKAINTISNNGEVTRGVCKITNNYLQELEESKIKIDNGKLYAKPLGYSGLAKEIPETTLVSMNLFGLNKNILSYVEEGFYEFLNNNKENLQTKEYFIPTFLTNLIKRNKCNIKILTTNDKWFGLTYKEDYNEVFNGIKLLRDKGLYPNPLWKI